MLNVYMLTTDFSAHALSPDQTQQRFENAFRKALKGTLLVNEFSRVSPPDQSSGKMAVICSEGVAAVLRTRTDLGVQELTLDKDRTHRRHMAYGDR